MKRTAFVIVISSLGCSSGTDPRGGYDEGETEGVLGPASGSESWTGTSAISDGATQGGGFDGTTDAPDPETTGDASTGSSGMDETGTTDGEESDASGTSSGTENGPLGEPGHCCSINSVPGCTEPGIEACVCDFDDYCCNEAWDFTCVQIAQQCGKTCDPDSDVNEPCCQSSDAPGCESAELESCVCASDPYCCEDGWDDNCVALASLCGAECIL